LQLETVAGALNAPLGCMQLAVLLMQLAVLLKLLLFQTSVFDFCCRSLKFAFAQAIKMSAFNSVMLFLAVTLAITGKAPTAVVGKHSRGGTSIQQPQQHCKHCNSSRSRSSHMFFTLPCG
jgi:hypothetical protein